MRATIVLWNDAGLAKEFYLISTHESVHFNTVHVTALVAALDAAVKLLQRVPDGEVEQPTTTHLFPHHGNSGGGAVAFITEVCPRPWKPAETKHFT